MPTVLIVDDEAENRYLLECLFRGHGYQVMAAGNGQQALEMANDTLPDLVIADILMPVMDGFSLCRRWKQDPTFRRVPFVFYTATYTDPKDEELALSLGAERFIVKPVDPDELFAIVQGIVEEQRQGQLRREFEPEPAEAPYLAEYNQALVRKLDKKVRQLEEANRELMVKDSALESSVAGIVFVNPSHQATYANPTASRLWGFDEQDWHKTALGDLFARPEEGRNLASRLASPGHFEGELVARRKDGGDFLAHVVAHEVRDSRGSPVCAMVSCTDVTEKRRLEEVLQRNQRLEALSLFSAGIAHDFNNLLTGLFNALELSIAASSDPEAGADRYATVRAAFERARDLTQGLVAFAKGGGGGRRRVRVLKLAQECCCLSLSGSGTRYQVESDDSVWPVEADATQLFRVFTNLIVNARQAMNDSGELRISARNTLLPAGQDGQLPHGDYVVVRFTDTGPGIAADALSRVFEPFFTTKPEGSGLGLPTSQAIVLEHGGRVEVTSTPGSGTTVEVWLPALPSDTSESGRPPRLLAHAGQGRILLMDDEESIRRLVERLLVNAGYQVTTAPDGGSAVALCGCAFAAGEPYDLVILDLTVRGGTGGVAALDQIRRINPHVVAIASTGYSDETTASHVHEAGFVAVLPKPYMSHELFSLLESVLGPTKRDRKPAPGS